MTSFLDANVLLALHAGLVRRYGGASDVLDPSRLSAALEALREPTAAHERPPAIADRAASLLFALCRAQALADDNRRVAAAAAVYFLLRNGAFLLAPQEDLERVVRRAAAGETAEDDVAEWLEAHAFWPAPPRPEATRFRLPAAAPAPR